MVADSYREKRHVLKVLGRGLILRVYTPFIKQDSTEIYDRDWFGDGKRVSFEPMKSSLHHLLGACVVALLSASCTGGAQHKPESVSGAPDQSPEPDAALAAERAPTDPEVMYRVFAAEYLGSEGDLPAAVGEYLEAAMQSNDPQIARRATQVAFATESLQQAAMAADRWALLDPGSVEAHESAALAMLLIGDYMGAEYQINKILDIRDDSTETWMLIANLLSQGASPDDADEILNRILSERGNVESAEVLYARSHLAIRSKDLRRAFELARQAAELNPDSAEYLTWAGRLALNLKLTETGLEYVKRAWQLDPENHDLSLAYADLLARNGYEDEARSVMQEMAQVPDVMLSQILFELAANDRPAAEKLYQKFEQMDFSDLQEKSFYLAQAAEALGYMPQAIEEYRRVTEGDRALAASIRVAELKALGGDIPAAREDLAELRRNASPVVLEESWLAEARILRGAGDREQAMLLLGEALTSLPGSIAILYTQALLAAEIGRVDTAERNLRMVIASQPENAAALNALGYTLADQTERYEEAEALIRQAYILQPDEPSIIDSMGWIAYRLGKLTEATEFLRKAWQIDKNPEIAAHLGEVLWVAGNKEEAMTIWREGRQVDAENAVLVETLERLGVTL
jgi:tetratricopeptide (TPR) repeat protein